MKKWKSAVLALALVVALVVPGTALASPAATATGGLQALPHSSQWTEFSASMEVYVADLGDMRPVGQRWLTVGEEVTGVVTEAPGWDEIEGAAIVVELNTIAKRDFTTGEAEGSSHGSFVLTTADGESKLVGVIRSKMYGNMYTTIVNEGTWVVVKGTGVFATVRAKGQWCSALYFDPLAGTYVGEVTFSGSHRER